jgi:hypothetical protein
MACSRHLSFASWRLQVFRRIFLPPNDLHCHARNSSRRSLHCTSRLLDIDDGRQQDDPKHSTPEDPTRSDADEEKYVKDIRPSQQLPQSPLLQKVKNPLEKKRKRRPKKHELDRLKDNPWAVALASPPRLCSITASRVPKDLLGEWGLVRRPGSEKLWFMPVGLLQDELKQAAVGPGAGVQEEHADNRESKPPAAGPLDLPVIRMADRLLLLKEITASFANANSGKRAQVTRLIPFRWKHPKGPITSRRLENLVWREDMPSFVLKNMRKEAVKALERASRGSESILDPSAWPWRSVVLADYSLSSLMEGLSSIPEIDNMECGGVLIMGSRDSPDSYASTLQTESDHSLESEGSSPGSPSGPLTSVFPDYVTLPQRGSKVPIFDLSVLLSEADLERLRHVHPRFRQPALFFRPGGRIFVDAMLALWRLKGSTMYDREFLAQDPDIDPVAK